MSNVLSEKTFDRLAPFGHISMSASRCTIASMRRLDIFQIGLHCARRGLLYDSASCACAKSERPANFPALFGSYNSLRSSLENDKTSRIKCRFCRILSAVQIKCIKERENAGERLLGISCLSRQNPAVGSGIPGRTASCRGRFIPVQLNEHPSRRPAAQTACRNQNRSASDGHDFRTGRMFLRPKSVLMLRKHLRICGLAAKRRQAAGVPYAGSQLICRESGSAGPICPDDTFPKHLVARGEWAVIFSKAANSFSRTWITSRMPLCPDSRSASSAYNMRAATQRHSKPCLWHSPKKASPSPSTRSLFSSESSASSYHTSRASLFAMTSISP